MDSVFSLNGSLMSKTEAVVEREKLPETTRARADWRGTRLKSKRIIILVTQDDVIINHLSFMTVW